ncbi:EF-hand domain-containing protein [Bdellovibrio sp. HCB209]|uniref:EF-hand domain-containing protein n=1 Tax=Bdellovibrio sp. HCB209 TaxID=3394354 RepID=UPI0039B3F932
MRKSIALGSSLLLLSGAAWAADDNSVVTVSKDVPMAVNSVSSGESVVGAPASGTVTRSGRDSLTINIVNSCFPTNLRAVSNPLAKSSVVSGEFKIAVGSKEYTILAEYPSIVATASGTGDAGKISTMSAEKAKVLSGTSTITSTAAVYGNVVQFKTKIPTGISVDENGKIDTSNSGKIVLKGSEFEQIVENCNTGPVWGAYGWSSKIPTYGCGEFMGKDGVVSATFGGVNVSPDRSVMEIFVSFPGETNFCGGYWSPLMVFFDDKIPKFTNVSEFPLNPGGKVHWPEANSPGYFVAFDKDGNGKIDQKDELFGDGIEFSNGFEALKKFDSNKDGVIDSKDKMFNRLVLWQDKNGDGVSQKKEIVKLSSKIMSISLKYETNLESLAGKAEIRERATFKYKNAKGKVKTGNIYDIWFAPYIETSLADNNK